MQHFYSYTIYNMVGVFLSHLIFFISSIPQILILFSLSLALHNHVCLVGFSAPSPCPVSLPPIPQAAVPWVLSESNIYPSKLTCSVCRSQYPPCHGDMAT